MSAWTDFRRTVRGKVPQYNLRDNVGGVVGEAAALGVAGWSCSRRSCSSTSFRASRSRSSTRRLLGRACSSHPIALYVLVAIGLNIVVGYAGLLDLGYVAFFAIGAYTIGVLTSAHGSLGVLGRAAVRDRSRRCSPACCSARRRCASVATTSQSSRSGSARSSASPRTTPSGSAAREASPNIPRPADIGPLHFEGLEREAVLLRSA